MDINLKDKNDIVCLKLQANYRLGFPQYPPLVYNNNWLYGMWMMGNNYKGSGYHGAFPPQFLKRVGAMFEWMPNCLQLFSGSLKSDCWEMKENETDLRCGFYEKNDTLDINPENNPTIMGDAEDLRNVINKHYDKNSFYNLIIADPPYTEEDANKYGYPMVSRNKVVKECHKVLNKGGFLVWLDQAYPMYRKTDWDLIATIGMIRSTNHRVRTTFIFRKKGQ